MKKSTSKTDLFAGSVTSEVFFVKGIEGVAVWYSTVLGIEPYRNEIDFVGFEVGRSRLCFHKADAKSGTRSGAQVAYWGVDSITSVGRRFIQSGTVWYRRPIRIPEGGRVCQLKDLFGNIIGLAD
jgi:hypothetical protein